ncbi:DMT family transporter [Chitinimonas koreensis]|uniref:DMT family transporter n=1 Tax=Chitinimonas koreensis TaxID=356302 RepID=UPI0004055C50|nr:EamA family transporter [Chitinimonas koreensis]
MNPSVLLLLLVTLVWGTTFPLLKSASATLSGIEISALRFFVAGLAVLTFALKAPRAAWRDGAMLGAAALVSYVSQAFGLEHISSNRSAFLTSLNVLMVPFVGWLLFRGRIGWQVLGAATLACCGIALMSWEGGGNWLGDGATLLCALAYAVYTLLLSRVARHHEARALAATQIVLMALFAGLAMLAGGSERLASLPARAEPAWAAIVYLGLVATAAMLFLQAIGQRHVSAEKAAVIYALEPVFAALFGWLWLGEVLGLRGAVGGALVVLAVVVSEWRPAPQPALHGGQ